MITKLAGTLVDYMHNMDSKLTNIPTKNSVVDIFTNKYNVKADEHLLDEGTANNLMHVTKAQKPTSIKNTSNLITLLEKNEANKNAVNVISKIRDAVSKNMDRDTILIDKKYENAVPLIAHEYGHAMNSNNKFLSANRHFKDNINYFATPFIAGQALEFAGEVANNRAMRRVGTALRASASAPELIDEYYASKNARKVLREAGLKERPISLDAAYASYLAKHLAVQGSMKLLTKGLGTFVRKL